MIKNIIKYHKYHFPQFEEFWGKKWWTFPIFLLCQIFIFGENISILTLKKDELVKKKRNKKINFML